MAYQAQVSTTTNPVKKARRRRLSHSSAHISLSKVKHRKPGVVNWGDGPNGILRDARVQADYAYKLDQHINECSTKSRTRKRAIKAYQLTVERLQMAIQYQEPNGRALNIINEPLDFACKLIGDYRARMEQLKAEEDTIDIPNPEPDIDVMDEDVDEKEEDEEEDDEMDDGNETVTSTPRTPGSAARRNLEGRCMSLEGVPTPSGYAQDVNELH